MRISERALPIALLLLAGCSREAAVPPPAEVPGATVIACALGPGAALAKGCTVERARSGNRVELVLHHPDGGFRRLLVTPDGRGIATADGAVPAEVRRVDARDIEIAVDGDVYRLPAAPARP